ncbi:MAG: hypothetical protein V4727_02120 [Verrucomicrobiota bacterium]
MEALSQISLGAAVLLIFAVCAVYMLIRGLLRTITNLSVLGLSIWIGFLTWQKAPSLAFQWTNQTSSLITTGLPILTFILSFIIIRKILRFFFTPISTPPQENDDGPPPSRSLTGKLFVTFIFASVFCLIAAAVLHHITSVAEIRDHAESGGAENPFPGFAVRLKNSLTGAIPASLMDKLDPLASEPRVQLAKMIAGSSEKSSQQEMDPKTGQPIPSAGVVDNPELVSLAKKGRFSTLLRHPLLTEAINDPMVKKALGIK